MSRKAIGIVVGLCFCLSSPQAFAENRVNEAVRLSKLTLSAMECANFAPNDEEAGRLSEIAISAGKKFLELIPTLSDEEQKLAGPNIAVLWRGVPGYSNDFVLGRVWQEMENSAYKSLGDDTKEWKYNKSVKYSEKNCSIIR
jgi:hypothetical protein